MGFALKEYHYDREDKTDFSSNKDDNNHKAAARTITSNTHGYLASRHFFIPISQIRKPNMSN